MQSNEFQNLINARQSWVESSKKNNFDFDSILPGLYYDPSHFIYEILQNAEDKNAKEIAFNLSENYLEIVHNGENFDFPDIDGVTGIGISTKKDDLNSIGKFGIGFKSVFAITQTPIIHSGDYHIKIEEYVLPSVISTKYNIGNTNITLPFNHSKRSKSEVFQLIENKLENIGLTTLLFLSNIEEIKWQTPTKNGHYYKSSEEFRGLKNAKKVSIISKKGNEEFFEEYLVIDRPITNKLIRSEGKELKKELKVEVAFRISRDGRNKETIIPIKDSKLVVFFSTEKVTYLNFLVQGPYKTTPNRENIPLEDEQNKIIIQETSILVAESILIIKELGFLNTSFLEVLPIVNAHHDEPIYKTIYSKVKELFLSIQDLLPTNNGNYTSAEKSILARVKDLPEFLINEDIEFLFKKKDWINTDISENGTRELWDYLVKELGIKVSDFEDFARQISSEFIARKDDNWLIKFYNRLLDQNALWREGSYGKPQGVLRRKPIISLKIMST